MGLDCYRNVGEDVPRLLPADLNHRQHRLDKAVATRALGAKGQLPPDHRVPPAAAAWCGLAPGLGALSGGERRLFVAPGWLTGASVERVWPRLVLPTLPPLPCKLPRVSKCVEVRPRSEGS